MKFKFNSIILAVTLTIWSLTSCSEENPANITGEKGKEVNFAISSEKSRTWYGQASWGTSVSQADIFWGNPYNTESEEVIIYGSPCATGRDYGRYSVSGFGSPDGATDTSGSANATTVTKMGDFGVQWGEKPADGKVNFISVYPSWGGEYMNANTQDGYIRTRLDNGQSPVKFNLSTTQMAANASIAPANKTAAVEYIGYPDMKGAIMVATKTVDWGSDLVELEYDVITDAIDITISGPAMGLLNAGTVKANNIGIMNVKIKSKSGAAIAGVFDYNPSTGDIQTVLPLTEIQLQTAAIADNGAVVYPRLSTASGNENLYDKLRLRAFVLPGTKIADLQIQVETTVGIYYLEGSKVTGELQNGKIHRIITPRLDTDGLHDFDFSKWMSNLDPTIYATELSIPGSWESFNPNFQASTDASTQFNAGIRAFMARPSLVNDELYYIDNSTSPATNIGTISSLIGELGKELENRENEFCVLQITSLGSSQEQMDALNKLLTTDSNCIQYVYQEEITPNTTISDLSKKIVIKGNIDGTTYLPVTDTPAIFSRWASGSLATTGLYWGTWADALIGNTGLSWCYQEADNWYDYSDWMTGSNGALGRVDPFITESQNQYNQGNHNTWFYLCIGGVTLVHNGTNWVYDRSSTATMKVAATLNEYTYSKLADPNRTPCPMGLVMFNWSTGTTANPTSLFGRDLIRVIINNNNAFILNRKAGTQAQNNSTFGNGGTAVQ